MLPYLREQYGNASSRHEYGRAARRAVEFFNLNQGGAIQIIRDDQNPVSGKNAAGKAAGLGFFFLPGAVLIPGLGSNQYRNNLLRHRLAEEVKELVRRAETERREAVLGSSARYFGPEAARPREYVEKDWMAEAFTRGCYGAHFAPGMWTSYGGALRQSVGRIHWAGAETSPVWNGYLEGAVRTGEQVAARVLAE